jgi:PAS domain S-box-containing protein
MLLDRDLRFVEINRAYGDVTRRARETLVGVRVFDAFPSVGETRERLEGSMRRALDEGQVDSIPWLHYAIPRPQDRGGGFEDRWWSCTHIPIRNRQGGVAWVLQHTQDVTEIRRLQDAAFGPRSRDGTESAIILSQDMLRRVESIQHANESLRAERSHLRSLFMQAPGFMAVLRGPDHVYEMVNTAYQQLVGHRDFIGIPVRQAVPEAEEQGYMALLDRVLRSGEAFVGRGMRLELQRAPGAAPEERFIDFIFQPIFDAEGKPTGIFVEGADITDRIRAEQRQTLLVNELNHRVKNTLATVQAIAGLTLRRAASPGEFAGAFEARLRALSKTHDMLTREGWEGADLAGLVAQELDPYGPARAAASGPLVRLPPRIALALGLVLHELAANAARYGALSADAGRVLIDWRLREKADGLWLEIGWREAGGPPVRPPTRTGFGSRLLDRSVGGELRGELSSVYAEDGVRHDIRIPLSDETSEAPR